MEISVLFVCLGNICRSPLAEGIFQSLVDEAGLSHLFKVDSAGTGSWHVGEPPDPRAQGVARENGVRLLGRARRLAAADLATFDWVVAMDRSNRSSIESLSGPSDAARIHLLREFDPEAGDPDVPDPYYGGPGGFQEVFDIVDRSCRVLLDHVLEESGD
jgi:protein-tyrosine phosphatase